MGKDMRRPFYVDCCEHKIKKPDRSNMHTINLSNDELSLLLIAIDDSLAYMETNGNEDHPFFCEAVNIVYLRDLRALRTKIVSVILGILAT
jgi:hypothetical protein